MIGTHSMHCEFDNGKHLFQTLNHLTLPILDEIIPSALLCGTTGPI